MMLDDGHDRLDVVATEPEPRTKIPSDHGPGAGVVTRPALPNVVQQRTNEQQIGPGDVAGRGGRPGRGLHQMPVDGEGVHGIALRPVTDPFPVRQHPDDQSGLVERLPDPDRRRPCT